MRFLAEAAAFLAAASAFIALWEGRKVTRTVDETGRRGFIRPSKLSGIGLVLAAVAGLVAVIAVISDV